MSRLGRRVERLEGGPVEGLDIIAEGPGWMSEEQAFAEVEAIAREHGVTPPFRTCIFVIQTFGEPEEGDHVEITFVGRFGVDADLAEPLRSGHEGGAVPVRVLAQGDGQADGGNTS